MVAPCGSAAGQIKTGYGRATVITSAAAEALITAFASPAAAIVMAPIIAGVSYDLLTLCAAGDPGDPVLTDADLVAVLGFVDVNANLVAAQRIIQWFTHMIWPTWCQCADGTIPATPTTTALPVPNASPGLPTGPSGTTCWNATGIIPQSSTGNNYANSLDPRTSDMPASGAWPAGQKPQLINPPPTGIIGSVTAQGIGSIDLWDWLIQYRDSTGALIGGSQVSSPSLSGNITYTSPLNAVPSNTRYTDFIVQGPITLRAGATFKCTLQYFCGPNTDATPVVPCCPPDPTLDGKLNRVLALEQIIIQLLGKPLAKTTDGVRHAGLSGAGSITLVDSDVAVRVEVKTSLASFPVHQGDPNFFFNVGFITPISVLTPLRGSRLVYQNQIFSVPPITDQIGYTLAPGVTIDIVELIPQ